MKSAWLKMGKHQINPNREVKMNLDKLLGEATKCLDVHKNITRNVDFIFFVDTVLYISDKRSQNTCLNRSIRMKTKHSRQKLKNSTVENACNNTQPYLRKFKICIDGTLTKNFAARCATSARLTLRGTYHFCTGLWLATSHC